MIETTAKSSDIRLIDAVIDIWETGGADAVSARQLSANADVPASSIYHHFRSLEQLLVLAQERAQRDARLWGQDRLAQMDGLSTDSRAFPGFFAGLVDDWVHDQRGVAFAWREGQLLRTKSPAGAQVRAGWRTLWRDFWEQACDRFGLSHGVDMVDHLFENEAFLHMLKWRRAVDRAGLDELAQGIGAWLMGEAMPASPWRDFARNLAMAQAPEPPDHDPTTARIAEAAAALVEEAGPSGVTHRAVAERAELTLGVVSHKLRTKSELLQAGYEGIYVEAASRVRARASAAAADAAAALDGIADFLTVSRGGRGVDALHLAVARDAALRPFGLQLRYLRGATSRSLLSLLRPDHPEPGHLEAAILSGFLAAVTRLHADSDADHARAKIRADIVRMIAIR